MHEVFEKKKMQMQMQKWGVNAGGEWKCLLRQYTKLLGSVSSFLLPIVEINVLIPIYTNRNVAYYISVIYFSSIFCNITQWVLHIDIGVINFIANYTGYQRIFRNQIHHLTHAI